MKLRLAQGHWRRRFFSVFFLFVRFFLFFLFPQCDEQGEGWRRKGLWHCCFQAGVYLFIVDFKKNRPHSSKLANNTEINGGKLATVAS